MALNEIITNRFSEDLKDTKKREEFQEESLEYLKKEGALFSNIGVVLLSSRASLERVSYLYYLRLLQKRQNLL
jgi:lipid II:glycine glycyltransferase (peptidoglycan interpeptide bridge formation enzyme)